MSMQNRSICQSAVHWRAIFVTVMNTLATRTIAAGHMGSFHGIMRYVKSERIYD